eukprot:g17913.t1
MAPADAHRLADFTQEELHNGESSVAYYAVVSLLRTELTRVIGLPLCEENTFNEAYATASSLTDFFVEPEDDQASTSHPDDSPKPDPNSAYVDLAGAIVAGSRELIQTVAERSQSSRSGSASDSGTMLRQKANVKTGVTGRIKFESPSDFEDEVRKFDHECDLAGLTSARDYIHTLAACASEGSSAATHLKAFVSLVTTESFYGDDTTDEQWRHLKKLLIEDFLPKRVGASIAKKPTDVTAAYQKVTASDAEIKDLRVFDTFLKRYRDARQKLLDSNIIIQSAREVPDFIAKLPEGLRVFIEEQEHSPNCVELPHDGADAIFGGKRPPRIEDHLKPPAGEKPISVIDICRRYISARDKKTTASTAIAAKCVMREFVGPRVECISYSGSTADSTVSDQYVVLRADRICADTLSYIPKLFVLLVLALAFPILIGWPTLVSERATPEYFDYGAGPQHVGTYYFIPDDIGSSQKIWRYTPREYYDDVREVSLSSFTAADYPFPPCETGTPVQILASSTSRSLKSSLASRLDEIREAILRKDRERASQRVIDPGSDEYKDELQQLTHDQYAWVRDISVKAFSELIAIVRRHSSILWKRGVPFKQLPGISYDPQIDPELERKHRRLFLKRISHAVDDVDRSSTR